MISGSALLSILLSSSSANELRENVLLFRLLLLSFSSFSDNLTGDVALCCVESISLDKQFKSFSYFKNAASESVFDSWNSDGVFRSKHKLRRLPLVFWARLTTTDGLCGVRNADPGDFGTKSGVIIACDFTGNSSNSSGFMKLDEIGPSSEMPRWMVGLYFGMYGIGFGGDRFGTRSDEVRRKLDVFTNFFGLGGVFAAVKDFVMLDVGVSFIGVDVAYGVVGENRSSNCRLADINGSYLSDNPLRTEKKKVTN